MIRERVIRVHIDDDALSFNSEAQVETFLFALGRMVSFGMKTGDNRGLEHVELYVDKHKTFTGAFYPARNWRTEGPAEHCAPFIALHDAIQPFKAGAPVVIGGVLCSDGEYSYSEVTL